MTDIVFYYEDTLYPYFIKDGNAQQYIRPVATKLCKGKGVDIGCNRKEWSLPGSDMVDLNMDEPWNDAYNIPVSDNHYDYVFSSHCLEHLPDYYTALEEWARILKPGGVLLLYLPHKRMTYWHPRNNRKHLRICHAEELQKDLEGLGFHKIITSGCDMAFSFTVFGVKK